MAVGAYGIAQSSAKVTKLRFQVVFKAQEGAKNKTRTREIVLPNKTDLADDSYDNIIRRHIVKKWEFKKTLPDETNGKVV